MKILMTTIIVGLSQNKMRQPFLVLGSRSVSWVE